MQRLRVLLLGGVLALLALPGVAKGAGEPIMPLGQVRAGMHCTGSSVVRGTAISTFDVEVLDVIAGDSALRQPYILIQVSGPAVDATGIGPGFSGSPIRCADGAGTQRIIGAVSEGIGSYGNKQALATPIESVLGVPVDPPASVRVAPSLVRAARPLATPLSFGGLSPAVARVVQSAAAKAGKVVYAAPPPTLSQTSFPVQSLVPGASMATGLASGDITAGAIGTVAYVDGSTIWGFGHPLDGAGRRSLFLQDAYVYSVVNNPVGSADLQTYKYAAIGHDLGVLTNDGISAVVGRTGVAPPQFPLKVIAHDLDTKEIIVGNMKIADETAIGLPTGTSSLAQVGSIAVAQLAYEILDGAPARQSGTMCVRLTIAETKKPLRFCNSYVGGGGGSQSVGGGPLVADFGDAAGTVDGYNFGPLHITDVEVDIRLSRSLRQAFILEALGPQEVRRGKNVRVRIRAQRVNGPKLSRYVSVHVPKGTPKGPRYLTLTGTSADLGGGGAGALDLSLADLFGGDESDAGAEDDESGPRTIGALREAFEGIHRTDGVTASFRPVTGGGDEPPSSGPEASAQKERQVLRDPNLRFSGSAKILVFVR